VAELGRDGGDGGLIALGASGDPVLPFNSAGMYRGTIGADGAARTAIYGEALA
jgi:L-asparaginase / beta-aspartyl-peptidase